MALFANKLQNHAASHLDLDLDEEQIQAQQLRRHKLTQTMNRLESSLTLYTGYLGDMHPTVRGILKSLLEVATDLDMPSACRRYKKRIEKAAAQEASLPVKSPEIHAAAGPRSCACSCHDHTPAGIAWRAPVPHFFSDS